MNKETNRDPRAQRSKPAFVAGDQQRPSAPQAAKNLYAALSLRDLLEARDQYHIHLMRHPNVVATAIGYYRIRRSDSQPSETPVVKGTGKRTLENSEIRPYSWPAVLVFVSNWIDPEQFGKGRSYDPDKMVPPTLYLADGRRVPVCVLEAPRDPVSSSEPPAIRYPLNNIGSGHPVLIEVQEREHVATIACLVTDGHKAYALTNRHVTGDAGQVLSSRLGGRTQRVGIAAPLQATRVPFSQVYRDLPGGSTYINMDVGLIDIDDVNAWTTKLQDRVVMGPMVDLEAVESILSLIGRRVCGYGAASRWIAGEIQALFYRYKSRGGFEYVADFFIGPRTPKKDEPPPPAFVTRPGDSGTLWLVEPASEHDVIDASCAAGEYRPLAIQWGANRLYSGLSSQPRAYALATALSTVCDRLDVDVVRGWNLDQPDTWGAVGHFSIASRVVNALSNAVPTLAKLMRNNAAIVSHDDKTILNSEFRRMGDDAFIPMADVPDFFWKHGKQGHSRAFEGPNHFADMDQKRPSDGADLLQLCEDPANVNPAVWNEFYESVKDLLEGGPIELKHRGLLPFRVWQIFDGMVSFIRDNKMPEFVCAAGVLTHYVGDACQPLHISFLHDGDPLQAKTHIVRHRDGTQDKKHVSLGQGVHSAYEDKMVNAKRKQILDGLDRAAKVAPAELVTSGHEAAVRTVRLMRETFKRVPPQKILDAYLRIGKGEDVAEVLWHDFGTDTIAVMQAGTHLLAVLWESAWRLVGGEDKRRDTGAIEQDEAMAICAPSEFLPSCNVQEIAQFLSRPA
jgi:hypothetical protein